MMKGLSLRLLATFTFTATLLSSRADEGMWLFTHLQKIYPQMKELGLKLTPEDIYSINQSSLKDAVVSLSFCTAEIVSPQGLMLTNHHCAYDAMQNHTTTENNYLDVGFWARSKSEELPAEGMTASILVRLEDVTHIVKSDFGIQDEGERELRQQEVADSLITAATEGTDYEAEIVDMFGGNQAVLFVYITYRDLRLVGVPPQSIGKFGGDTDNWEWPRHTGDFSILRIYTAPDGTPADYSEANVPFVPKHYFPVSVKGVEKGDFAMILGFPGSTDRYSTSYGIELAMNQTNPQHILLRDIRLTIWKDAMDQNDSVRYQYSSKHAQISNYWKYFIGQNEGFQRLGTVESKRKDEQAFLTWANANPERKLEYGNVFNDMEEAIRDYAKYDTYWTYLRECILEYGAEILRQAWRFRQLERTLEGGDEGVDEDAVAAQVSRLRSGLDDFFKDYRAWLDEEVFAALMDRFHDDVPRAQMPAVVTEYDAKFKGDWTKAADWVYKKSFIDGKPSTEAFLDDPKLKTLRKDPAYRLSVGIIQYYIDSISGPYTDALSRIEEASKLYIKGLMEMNAGKPMYPDANSTERLTYGRVLDYFPRDAVQYMYYTTADGVVQKYVDGDDEFDVPDDFLGMLKRKDYGRYGKNGELYVCFLTDNDITGGNSGSPVLNADGHLIGIAFDGNWEAMTGDLVYDAELKRTINVDIRYVLFVVDKYAGAKNIVDEMTIVE
jgi:hypothetical protein